MIELIECEACNVSIDIDNAVVEKYTEDPYYGQQEMYFCPDCAEDESPTPWHSFAEELADRLFMEEIQ
jgi:hypothetical protein